MPLRPHSYSGFQKTLLALAASAALTPNGAMALDLSQAPPGSTEPYVRPNVIISVDDSGSMDYRVDREGSTGDNTSSPNANGTWPGSAKRMTVLKYSLKQVFNDATLLPDKKIRLAWQVMWNNGGAPNATSVNSGTKNVNSMDILTSTHRQNFLNFVNSLKPGNGTPSHLMFQQADAYMRRDISASGPWASDPGDQGAPYLGCRRNYHIMMTDGRWNGTDYDVTNTNYRDNATNLTLPDGTVYGGSTAAQRAKTALYRDGYSKTLADWAFHSWANPLQTSGLTGSPQPAADYRKANPTENFGNDSRGNPAILDRYWNPRYDPATWPHMVTFTIGFSDVASQWPGASDIIGPTQKVPFDYNGSFPDFVTGNKAWPKMDNENKRSLDLWHAALNGRGRFYAVTKGEDLEKAFRDIFGQINTQTEPDLTSSATSGSNVSRNNVGKFTGNYEPKNAWKGFITAETVKTDGTTEPTTTWNGKNTADLLDAMSPSTRLILSWNDKKNSNNKEQGGVAFKWSNDETYLSTAQKTWLRKKVDGTEQANNFGEGLLNYVRGTRSMEGSTDSYNTDHPFRQRSSIQGDIINSDVWYTGAPVSNYSLKGYANFAHAYQSRQPIIYVGGNDGMLHGFSATNGSEKIAYVPKGAIPQLRYLGDPTFDQSHKFTVDGSPMTGDVDMGAGVQDPDDPNYDPNYTPGWRTLLVGSMGAGGKGYFVLDVTNPTTAVDASGATPFSEANARQLVKLDRTHSSEDPVPDCLTGLDSVGQEACVKTKEEDADIGFITAKPVKDDANSMRTTQITRLNNNRWAVVLGNGYNSTNQRPVLLIQYLDGNMELKRIPATNETAGTGNAHDNGLSAPALVDLNGDARPDVAYAGDTLGNMWKFDLTSVDDSEWKVAFGAPGATSSGTPLFTARGPSAYGNSSRSNAQPITIAPTVRANDRKKTVGTGSTAKKVPVGGMMVAFGTGRNVTKDDEGSVQVQTLYSVLDNTRYRIVDTPKGKRLEVHPGGGSCPDGADCVPAPAALGIGVSAANLAQQEVTSITTGGGDFAKIDPVTDVDWSTHNGWYMDMPAVGERLLKPMEFYDGSNILVMFSQVPAKGSDVNPDVESCESTSVDVERQFRTFINIMDGKRPSVQLVDTNGDTHFNAASDENASRKEVTKGTHTLITKGDKIVDIDTKNNKEDLARMPEQSLRPSWRQVK